MSKSHVVLKKGKADSILRKHPWVFSGAVKDIYGSPEEGDIVSVVGPKGEFYGFGHFQNGSIIVRLLSFEKGEFDKDFLKKRIEKAVEYRKNLGFLKNESHLGNSFRLIYGEADMLSGLIVDFYNGVAVIQAHSTGFHLVRAMIAECLSEVMGDLIKCVYYKPKDKLKLEVEPAKIKGEILYGELPSELTVEEYSAKFFIDVEFGQKTGFFIDQRENRQLVSSYSKDRKVLNMFCYTGGFSIAALNGGASLVHSVDASASAIEIARKNIVLNGYDADVNECFVADAYDFLEEKEMDYDIIVLDPPAFAKHMESRHRAVKGYQRLNSIAISKIKPGGFIFTYSCSQVVDKRLFESTIMSAAIISGRNVRVVQELTHAPCHAFNIAHPEGKYLKGLLLYVE